MNYNVEISLEELAEIQSKIEYMEIVEVEPQPYRADHELTAEELKMRRQMQKLQRAVKELNRVLR